MSKSLPTSASMSWSSDTAKRLILTTADVQIVWYAKEWLRTSDTQIGLLYASDVIGVVVFSPLANRLRKRLLFGVVALGSMMVPGVLTALMAFTHRYPPVLVIWAMRGGIDVLFLISAYSMTQLIVPNALLGRIITFTAPLKLLITVSDLLCVAPSD